MQTFDLSQAGDIPLGENVPFDLTLDVSVLNGAALEPFGWPHFDFELFVSDDQVFDDRDYVVGYRKTKCQLAELSKDISSTASMDLTDPGKKRWLAFFCLTKPEVVLSNTVR